MSPIADLLQTALALLIGGGVIAVAVANSKERVKRWALDNGFSDICELRVILSSWFCFKNGCLFCAYLLAVNDKDGAYYKICLSVGLTLISPVKFKYSEKVGKTRSVSFNPRK